MTRYLKESSLSLNCVLRGDSQEALESQVWNVDNRRNLRGLLRQAHNSESTMMKCRSKQTGIQDNY